MQASTGSQVVILGSIHTTPRNVVGDAVRDGRGIFKAKGK